jgi:intron-binding protein aquarius
MRELESKSEVVWEEIDDKTLGVQHVRGCEVYQVLDESKAVVGSRDDNGNIRQAVGNIRTYRVHLDTAQYQLDMTRAAEDGAYEPYKSFNLLMRRKPEENNFKAVLKTIRDLMETELVSCALEWT